MTKCVIVGAGTYGEVYAAYLAPFYSIEGFIDDDKSKHGTRLGLLPVIGGKEVLPELLQRGIKHAFVPIGNNEVRTKYLTTLREMGFETPSFVHPLTNIHETVQIGESTYILPGSAIMPYTQVGEMCMISMGVNVAHHCRIQTGVFLSQGVNVGASIQVGNNVFIGISATIMTGIKKVGNDAIIGGGAVVIRDVEDRAVMVGNPARVLKYR